MANGRLPGPIGNRDTQILDIGTLARFLSPPPGLLCEAERPIDELTPIAVYLAQEMSLNAASDDVAKMRGLNEFSATECITDFRALPVWQQLLGLGITPEQCIGQQLTYPAAALLVWAEKVRQGGDWDHKPIISQRFNGRNPSGEQNWHLYGRTLYYYDVWSNIHYGYVGLAAGFSEGVLLDGAGLEQIGSTLARWQLPSSDPTVQGLRAWDDPPDRVGIQIGMALYGLHADGLAPVDLLDSVLKTPGILTKPYQP